MSRPRNGFKGSKRAVHPTNSDLPYSISNMASPDDLPPIEDDRTKSETLELDDIRSKSMAVSKISSGKYFGQPTKIEPSWTNDGLDKQKKTTGFHSLFAYPRGTYFCLGNEFAERFSFYGMKAILLIYLISAHHLPSGTAKLIYHTFVFIAYFSPIFGSVLSDGYLGRYRVILGVSIIYCIGHVLLTLSAIPSIGDSVMKALDYTGLFVIAVATGGIKPCVSAFAADQFPESMAAERLQFFSFFYFMINLGALMSQIITPVLRRQPCLGSDTCFPLAFGVPAIFMCLATLVFWAGTPFYKMNKVPDNVIWRVCQCIGHALKEKFRSSQKKMHWLDYALPKYDKDLVDDIKSMFNVMILFVPVIIFWALFDQQGSTWVLQGSKMNGRVGSLTILPDQLGVLNPCLVICLIPIFEGLIYPFLSKRNIWTRPLRRMGWGGFLAALSFFMAGLLQLAVDKTAIVMPQSGHARVVVMNSLKCEAFLTGGHNQNLTVPPGAWKESDLSPNISLAMNNCGNWSDSMKNVTYMDPGSGYFVMLLDSGTAFMPYELAKTSSGKTRAYFLFEPRSVHSDQNFSVTVEQNGEVEGEVHYDDKNGTGRVEVEPRLIGSNQYTIFMHQCSRGANCTKTSLKSFNAETGAAHIFLLPAQNEVENNRLVQVIGPNSISILWQVPQYVVITIGEILFSISGLAFSYSQASPKMKSVFQAIWLLTTAFGNLIDMGISGSGAFDRMPAAEFFLYGSIMGAIMLLFVFLAWRYKPAKGDGESH